VKCKSRQTPPGTKSAFWGSLGGTGRVGGGVSKVRRPPEKATLQGQRSKAAIVRLKKKFQVKFLSKEAGKAGPNTCLQRKGARVAEEPDSGGTQQVKSDPTQKFYWAHKKPEAKGPREGQKKRRSETFLQKFNWQQKTVAEIKKRDEQGSADPQRGGKKSQARGVARVQFQAGNRREVVQGNSF